MRRHKFTVMHFTMRGRGRKRAHRRAAQSGSMGGVGWGKHYSQGQCTCSRGGLRSGAPADVPRRMTLWSGNRRRGRGSPGSSDAASRAEPGTANSPVQWYSNRPCAARGTTFDVGMRDGDEGLEAALHWTEGEELAVNGGGESRASSKDFARHPMRLTLHSRAPRRGLQAQAEGRPARTLCSS
ncbi:hypothetical protein HDZ31DRAFT_76688 [Schizophyllum fasciatum]